MISVDAFLVMKPEQPQWTRHFRRCSKQFYRRRDRSTDECKSTAHEPYGAGPLARALRHAVAAARRSKIGTPRPDSRILGNRAAGGRQVKRFHNFRMVVEN